VQHDQRCHGTPDENNRHTRVQYGRARPAPWDVWGGHCQEGETPKACAVRELREELGVEITETAALTCLVTRPVEGQEESACAYVLECSVREPSIRI
jgi:8-oxo-dGTP pyrophosphatase MutT (NUDIX family)